MSKKTTKRFGKLLEKVDTTKTYSLAEAIDTVKLLKSAKFDETVEIVNLEKLVFLNHINKQRKIPRNSKSSPNWARTGSETSEAIVNNRVQTFFIIRNLF